jgi:hypothetical protein
MQRATLTQSRILTDWANPGVLAPLVQFREPHPVAAGVSDQLGRYRIERRRLCYALCTTITRRR